MTVEGFLADHGAWFILPLAVIEGPFVSIATGILAGKGWVSWHLAIPLLVAGDLIGDALYYLIGMTGGAIFGRFGRRLRARLGPNATLADDVRQHAAKLLVLGKWTHTIGCAVLMACGAARVPMPRFLLINLLATVPKSALLFAVGYYALDVFPASGRYAALEMAIICAIGLLGVFLVFRSVKPAGWRR